MDKRSLAAHIPTMTTCPMEDEDVPRVWCATMLIAEAGPCWKSCGAHNSMLNAWRACARVRPVEDARVEPPAYGE